MDQTIPRESLRYCLYARKSTEQDERQAMSIDSQIKEMLELAQKEGIKVAEIKREAHSAKATLQRPVFNKMVEDIRAGKFNAILAWAPDRLSRNAGDLGVIVDMLDQKLIVEIRTFGQRFTNNPNEKFLLMILGAQGKLENDQKGVNVKRGLRARCERGLWPAPAPTGYFNEKRTDRKGYVIVDPHRAPVIKQVFEKVANEGWSGRKVYRWLYDIGFTTTSGKRMWLSNVYKVLNTPFYYGEFEYPLKSGKWYKGIHTPIITKELYMEAQKNIKVEQHLKYDSKEFAFTKLIKCGRCGSGITAQDKYKKLRDGSVVKYIYYGCTRSKDLHCKGGYIREEDLILQLIGIIDQVSVDELGMRKRLKDEAERYQKFQTVLGIKGQKVQTMDVDMKNYAKYVLTEGSIFEKRELLSNLKDKLVYTNKILTLA
ncbi:MAG: hypothetical protein A3D56_02485 [Candidatus Taylorbacteria bacterium RIFCSPHIGHO2_02_FULL_45_35]|uniref:Recombinase domain-containing protein n=1 Tax=Candidatus Taylorbacteria bacterium RIFCSPHIGHO2_02_FULL_45_35 TaxID=1802311 RepID=A0A1G2MPY1_9BACT|nr:MAG: hypothetical protein A3D56_02485 [Candidatus Taylorbacteria bacterium RIFCSPHIGHO2_02_FULL_45_35]